MSLLTALSKLLVALFAFMFFYSSSLASEKFIPIVIDDIVVMVNNKIPDTKLVKKTGQTTSYYTHDDGYYKKGIPTSYSRANEVVTDNATGLKWQDNGEIQDTYMNWNDAKIYCTDLQLDGGGWRLPTRNELISLVDYGRMFPSVNPIFVNMTPNGFWSATSNVSYGNTAWSVFFDIGNQSFDGKQGDNRVICTKGGFVK